MIGLKAFIKLFSFRVFAIFPIMVFEKTICVMSIKGARGVFCSGHAFWDSAPHQCVFLLKAAKPVRRRTPVSPGLAAFRCHRPWERQPGGPPEQVESEAREVSPGPRPALSPLWTLTTYL